MESEPTLEELLIALEMVNKKVTDISEYMPEAFKCEVFGKKPKPKKVLKAFVSTCKRLLEITENCPETLFGSNLGNCGNCRIGNFPQEMDREIGCMQEYYLREARKSIEAAKPVEEAPKDEGKTDNPIDGEEESPFDLETELELS